MILDEYEGNYVYQDSINDLFFSLISGPQGPKGERVSSEHTRRLVQTCIFNIGVAHEILVLIALSSNDCLDEAVQMRRLARVLAAHKQKV